MLVLSRKENEVTYIKVKQEVMRKALEKGEDLFMSVRSHKIRRNKRGTSLVNLAFYDPEKKL